MKKLSLIAAMSENRAIGKEGKIPWHLPEDLKHFRAITSGHPIIMGRKTFESIGRPLPGRENIVISRQAGYAPSGVTVVQSLDAAIETAWQKDTTGEIFVIGGGEIYKQALPRADRIYLTVIHQNFDGDAFFPAPEKDFEVVQKEDRSEPFKFSFMTLERSSK